MFSAAFNNYPNAVFINSLDLVFHASLDEQWQFIEKYAQSHGSSLAINRLEQTPLTFAMINKDLSLCQQLITMGADVNAKDRYDQSPLLLAFGEVELLSLLIKAGANCNATFQNIPILQWAISAKRPETYHLLLENEKIDIDQTDIGPLSSGYVQSFEEQARIQNKPLEEVVSATALQQGLKLTALHLACISGNYEVVELLLNKRANLQLLDHIELSPFYYALNGGHENICLLLLKHGFNLNASCLLHNLAILVDKQDQMARLVQWGANVNQLDAEGDSPLHRALISGKLTNISFLIKLGADVNQVNKKGQTPLHYAIHNYSPEAIQLLLDQQANVQVINSRYQTPALKLYERTWVLNPLHQNLYNQDGFLTSNLIDLRLLGHRFSLPGKIYKGMHPVITYQMFAYSIQSFIHMLNRQDLSSAVKNLNEAVNPHMTAKDYVEKLKRGEVVILHTGWRGHATSIILSQDMIVKCNRGVRGHTYPDAGMSFYKIHNPEALEQVIDSLLKYRNDLHINSLTYTTRVKSESELVSDSQKAKHLFEEGMNDLLKLEFQHFLKLKEQKSGNCGWVAAKMSLRAELIFSFLKEGQSFDEAVLRARLPYKLVTYADRQVAFSKLEILKQDPRLTAITSFDDLSKELAFACAKNSHREYMLRTLIEKKPELLQMTDASGKETLLNRALSQGAKNNVLFLTSSLLIEQGNSKAENSILREATLNLATFTDFEVVKQLIASGIFMNARNHQKKIPVQETGMDGHKRFLKARFECNANLRIGDSKSWTALHL